MQTARSIYYYQIVAVVLSLLETLLDYLAGVYLSHFKYGYFCLFCDYLQLIYSCRSVYVRRYQQRSASLTLEHLGKLSRMCGLT